MRAPIEYDWEVAYFTGSELRLQLNFADSRDIESGDKVQVALYIFPFKDKYGLSVKGQTILIRGLPS